MVIILFLIATIGISALTTWGVVIGIKKVKTLKPIKFTIPNIPNIVFPKIKIPNFNLKIKPKTTSVTILNPTIGSNGDVFQEQYWNTTNKQTNPKPSFPIPKNAWIMMIGVIVLGVVAMYFIHTWKMRKR